MLCAALFGCGSLSGDAPQAKADSKDDAAAERASNTGDTQLDLLNQGYSLLYADVSGLKLVDKLLLVKFESDQTHKVVTAISDYAGELAGQLEALAKRYPSLRIDLKPLPEIEQRKQAAAQKARVLSFAPVVGRTGRDFERTLLLTLSGGLNQLRFLAKVTADEERNDERRKLLIGAQQHFLELYKQTLKLLNARYYKHNTYDPAEYE